MSSAYDSRTVDMHRKKKNKTKNVTARMTSKLHSKNADYMFDESSAPIQTLPLAGTNVGPDSMVEGTPWILHCVNLLD